MRLSTKTGFYSTAGSEKKATKVIFGIKKNHSKRTEQLSHGTANWRIEGASPDGRGSR
jgi:hypothetical protein